MKRIALLILLLATSSAFADAFQPWARRDQRVDYIGAAADSKPIQGVKRGAKLLEYDTGNSYRWKGSEERGATTDWYELYDPMSLGTRLAGERNEDSTTGTDYINAGLETKCDTVDVATNSTTIYPGPARLYYYYVNTALSANTNIFKDNATSKFTLAQSLAVGSDKTFPGARFDTSLVFDPDDAATGNITVCYAPLDAGVTY